ncbi:agmatinase [Oceanicoccus sp. KOV_DT_Chl]|uniref:agmatinase n=1 Tax=Oceanicoccus sp. KOV_DT_Chl TaxID=1904639 RepID=UPI000C7A9FBA|nr:agmatinase [Oceanicoccus sp. KOV_DT_Chl]
MSDSADPTSPGDLAFTRESPYGTESEAMYSGATSFMRRRYSRDLNKVDVAVVGIPYDLATSNRPGARFGPRGIRQASTQLSWSSPWPWTFDPFDRLHVIDFGDCVFDSGIPANVPDEIEACISHIVSADVTPLSLGGDHFVTYPALKAVHAKHGPISLIHFDAHCDTWTDKDGRIDHGTMFYHAAKQGIVEPGSSVQIGMRTHNKETHGYNVFDALWLHDNGPAALVESIHRIVGQRPCYITFDIDFLDPSCAPGTGTPVCGGFDTITAIKILAGLQGLNIVGCDVVEVAPAYDHAEITSLAGATIATNMICLLAADKPKKI